MLRDRIEDAEDAAAAVAAGTGSSKSLSISSLAGPGPDNPLVAFRHLLEDIVAQINPSRRHQLSLALTWPFIKKDIAEKTCMPGALEEPFQSRFAE
ncbi:hypothetical protein BDW74DRAFT_161938 [Aspergillus multicolor]|uniref:uncharacterized protein n=1 Tax=Aspergillus multicolor TaxID=41759 RepID=UPI003CCE0405